MILLRSVGVLYFLLGIWCAFNLKISADFVGINWVEDKGLAEFFSIYGGLQFGLGTAMLSTSFIKEYCVAAVFFSAIFSSGLALFRVISILFYSHDSNIIIMAASESVIALLLWLNWTRIKL